MADEPRLEAGAHPRPGQRPLNFVLHQMDCVRSPKVGVTVNRDRLERSQQFSQLPGR